MKLTILLSLSSAQFWFGSVKPGLLNSSGSLPMFTNPTRLILAELCRQPSTLGPLFYSRANERRRNPSTRNVRQSLGHGRSSLCLYAHCYSSGTGSCADWCHHHAWNPKPEIHPNRALAARLLAGRNGL